MGRLTTLEAQTRTKCPAPGGKQVNEQKCEEPERCSTDHHKEGGGLGMYIPNNHYDDDQTHVPLNDRLDSIIVHINMK